MIAKPLRRAQGSRLAIEASDPRSGLGLDAEHGSGTPTLKGGRRQRKDTRLESEGAELLVLGQLLIQKIPTYKTYTNLRGYDLVATSPETNRSARIQVKSRWATDANALLIKNIDCDFVVLVRLNRGYDYSGINKRNLPGEDPEYYVLSAEDAKGLLAVRAWGKILWVKEKFECHRRRWDLIQDFLLTSAKRKPAKAV
jgi:hypothetical protein